MRPLVPCALFSLCLGCAGAPPAGAPIAPEERPRFDIGRRVEVEQIAPNVWLHRSLTELPEVGPYPANGLIVSGSEGPVLVDTAWTAEQTAVLLDWMARRFGGVRAVLVTHWHDDRTGGLAEAHRRGVHSYGSQRTVAELERHGRLKPKLSFPDRFPLAELGIAGEVYFSGAGHSVDNVVVWLSDQRVLFGGCLVRAEDAGGLGNTADADRASWPRSIDRLRTRYSNALLVVPGHGAAGSTALLDHTLELLSEASAQDGG